MARKWIPVQLDCHNASVFLVPRLSPLVIPRQREVLRFMHDRKLKLVFRLAQIVWSAPRRASMTLRRPMSKTGEDSGAPSTDWQESEVTDAARILIGMHHVEIAGAAAHEIVAHLVQNGSLPGNFAMVHAPPMRQIVHMEAHLQSSRSHAIYLLCQLSRST